MRKPTKGVICPDAIVIIVAGYFAGVSKKVSLRANISGRGYEGVEGKQADGQWAGIAGAALESPCAIDHRLRIHNGIYCYVAFIDVDFLFPDRQVFSAQSDCVVTDQYLDLGWRIAYELAINLDVNTVRM